MHARQADSAAEAAALTEQGIVLCWPIRQQAACGLLMPWWTRFWRRKNLGTHITDAPIVIAVGRATAGVDCAAVETMREHSDVAVYGFAAANTGVPGVISSHATERVLRAPAGNAVPSRAVRSEDLVGQEHHRVRCGKTRRKPPSPAVCAVCCSTAYPYMRV